jgi:hypothetical protein
MLDKVAVFLCENVDGHWEVLVVNASIDGTGFPLKASAALGI